MAETGFELNISGLEESLNKIDKSIKSLATTTRNSTNKMIQSISEVVTKGFGALENKSNELNKTLSNVGKGSNKGLKNIADDIIKVTDAMAKVKPKEDLGLGNIKRRIDELLPQLAKAREDITMYKQAIGSGKKTYIEWGQTGLKEAEQRAESLMRQIQALQNSYNALKNSTANIKDILGDNLGGDKAKFNRQQTQDFYKKQDEDAKKEIKTAQEAAKEKAKLRKEEEDDDKKRYEDWLRITHQGVQDKKKAEKAKTQATKQAIADQNREFKRQAEIRKQEEFKKNTSFSGAMAYSQQTKSINDQIKAIQYLKIARDNLDKSSLGAKEYENRVRQINKEIQRQQEEVNKLTGRVRESNNILTKFGSQLALLFSVSAIKNYVTQLIAVRGEFEMQQRSLQVLLKDKSGANKLWQQTIDLAVKSPFRVKELVSYTKQLAAYRIESDKLHDTTRRLADVSAGLGVDMQRLILAFGQVKAASFLRGTELRQFTEAGIPMLEELSQYLTEIEGTGVSVGEVFERISKRMISFKDVEAVFHRMTDAGGTFYKMQEEQSKTLKGMISNLKDSIDLMLNSIGESQEGVLKGSVDLIRRFVENWRLTATILKTVIAAFAMYKLNVVLTKKALIDYAIANKIVNDSNIKQLSIVNLVKLGWSALTKTIKSASVATKAFVSNNPIITVLSVLAGVIFKVYSIMKEHKEEIDEINKRYEEMAVKISEINSAFANANLEKNLVKQREELKKLLKVAEKEYYLNFDFNIEELDKKSIAEAYNKVYAEIQAQSKFAEDFEKKLSIHNRWTMQDDLNEDFNELGESAKNLLSILEDNVSYLREHLIQTGKYTEEFKKALAPRDVAGGETELAYMERLQKAFEQVTGGVRDFTEMTYAANNQLVDMTIESVFTAKKLRAEWGENLYDGFNKSTQAMNILDSKLKEAKKEYDNFIEKVDIPAMLSVSEKENRFKLAIDKAASQNNWSEFEKEYIIKWLNKDYTLNISYAPAKSDNKGLAEWAEQVKPEIEKINNRLKTKLQGAISANLFDLPDEDSDRDNYVKAIENKLKEIEDIKTRGKVKGQKIFTDKEVYNANVLSKEAEELKKILAIIDKSKDGQGKDWYLELAKGVREYHKDVLKNNKTMELSAAIDLAKSQNLKVLESALKGVGLTMDWLNNQNIDFSKEDGVVGLLNTIKSLPNVATETKHEIEKIISGITGEAIINLSIGKVESAERELENMFSNYEMTMELESEGLDSDYFLDLFGLRKVSADDIQKYINEKLGGLKLTGDFNNDELIKYISENKEAIGEDYADLYIKILENLNDKERKLLQERVKNNMKYAKQALTTIGQIRLSEIQEINAINNEYDAEIERAKGDTERIEKLKADRERALKGVKDKSEQDVNKALWEEFKGSEGFIRIFQDAEYASNRAINNMLDNLERFRDSLGELDIDELKAVADAMEKLENIKMERFPMVEMFKAMGDLRQQKLGLDNISTDTVGEVAGIKEGSITNRKQLRKAIEKYDKAIAEERDKQKGMTDEGALKASDATIESLIKQKKKLEEVEEQGKDAYARLKEGFGKFGGKINEVGQSLGVFQSSLENMGVNFSDGMKDALGTAQEVLGGIGTMAQGIASGNYLQAIMGLFQTLGALFQIGDKKKERQIQDNIKAIEKLGKAYEKLEKKIEEAYSIDTLQSATNSAMDNLEQQIKKQEEIIALEQAKKKSDKDKLDDYRDELDSQMEQLEEMKKEVVSKATDGAFDDVLSAADGFVDAWLEAFKETGDGLKGLEDNFNEMMLNIVKRQASLQIVGVFAERWKKELEKYVNANDTKLTTQEALKFAESVKADMPELSKALKAYFEAMKGVVDIDGQGDTMSGLQRGIHELSESTGEVIAAYLDSLRFFVADNNTQLKQLINNFEPATITTPILAELKAQTELIRTIDDRLGSVIGRGNDAHNGAYIKVVTNL